MSITSGVTTGTILRAPVRLVGGRARRALGSASPARVLAVFRRSVYCESAAGAIVCAGPASLGPGPLNALCDLPDGFDWEATGLRPGAGAAWDGTTWRLGASAVLSLAGARAWRPDPLADRWEAVTLARGLAGLGAAVAARPPAGGLCALIPLIAARPAAGLEGETLGDPLLGAAAPAIGALAAWMAGELAGTGAPAPVPPAAAGLIGLGPGLTPSGDDFVGGALVALRALGREDVARRLAAWALGLAPGRTPAISLAHLAAAADGEGSAAVHATLATIATGGLAGLDARLAAVGAIGHTSGWDALAGVAAACAAVLDALGARRNR
jgi:hypothetical protein